MAVTGVTGVTDFICVRGVIKSVLSVIGFTTVHFLYYAVIQYSIFQYFLLDAYTLLGN